MIEDLHYDLTKWTDPSLLWFMGKPETSDGDHFKVDATEFMFPTIATPPNSPNSGSRMSSMTSMDIEMNEVFDSLLSYGDAGIFSPPLTPDFCEKLKFSDNVEETIDPKLLGPLSSSLEDEIVDIETVDEEVTNVQQLYRLTGTSYTTKKTTKKSNNTKKDRLSKDTLKGTNKPKKNYSSKKISKTTSAFNAMKNADLKAKVFLNEFTSNGSEGEYDISGTINFKKMKKQVGIQTQVDLERKREMHNVLERKRREDLKSTFNDLAKVIPELIKENGKASKSQVLTHSIDTIKLCQKMLMERMKARKRVYDENYALKMKLESLISKKKNHKFSDVLANFQIKSVSSAALMKSKRVQDDLMQLLQKTNSSILSES